MPMGTDGRRFSPLRQGLTTTSHDQTPAGSPGGTVTERTGNIMNALTATTAPVRRNGLNLVDLQGLIDTIATQPDNAGARFTVTTTWQGGTKTESRIDHWNFRNEELHRSHIVRTDEPLELGGTDAHANPQEVLMSALNACMTVGYVAVAALMGIDLEFLSIETEGELDLRGFLDLAPVNPGYDEVTYTVRIKAENATAEQLEQLHAFVQKTSPNYANFAKPIALRSRLVIH